MPSKEKIIDIIFRCAEELNRQLSEESKLILEESTVITGENSLLDSLGLVTLLVSIEEHLNQLGISINILDKVSESSNFPFATIGEMSLWILGEI